MDSNLLDTMIGAKIVKFEYDEKRNHLDAVIVELKNGTQQCVFADDIDTLGLVRYA